MPEKDYLEKMLHQIADIFKLIEDNRGKSIHDKLTPELKARLDNIKDVVGKFAELNTKAFEASGLNEEQLEKMVRNPTPSLSEKELRILNLAKKIKTEIEHAKMQLAMQKKNESSLFDKDQKNEDPKKRKKKFKRLGGDTWMPL